jgi:hypothetical protein
VNWQIRVGTQSVIGAAAAADIVVGRLEYMAEHGSSCNTQRLLSEAIDYARLLRGWIREHEPKPTCDPVGDVDSIEWLSRQVTRPGNKAGPMSDG